MRDHLARRVVDDEDGGRQLLSKELRLLLGKFLQRHLHVAVERQPVHDLGRRQGHLGFGKVRGELREIAAYRRDRLELGARRLALGDHAGADGAFEHAVAGGTRGLRVAIGATLLGRLGERHEQCGLADGQPPRLLAEVGKGGSAHALDVTAEGSKAEIQSEYLLLREMPLELQCAHDLAQLGAARALVLALDQPRNLHRERGGARDDATVADELSGCARERA